MCEKIVSYMSKIDFLFALFLKNRDKQEYKNLILFTKNMDGRYYVDFLFTNSKQNKVLGLEDIAFIGFWKLKFFF